MVFHTGHLVFKLIPILLFFYQTEGERVYELGITYSSRDQDLIDAIFHDF